MVGIYALICKGDINIVGKHPTSRYEGKIMDKTKLKDLAELNSSAAYYDEDAGYYKRNSHYKRTSKFLNKQANKRLRQSKDYLVD